MKSFLLLCFCSFMLCTGKAGAADYYYLSGISAYTDSARKDSSVQKKQLNFFVISRPKKGKLDLASRYNIIRTKIKGFYRPNQFVSVVAKNIAQASSEIRRHILKKNARIGTIWFDSHGQYIKGYSSFTIGKDEINSLTLKKSAVRDSLQQLAVFTHNETKVVIGSCYGGATYYRSSVDYKDTMRMDGDLLMFELGKIFTEVTIYGSESWVMTKPGLFHKQPAVAGYPSRNLFHDICYKPAWENIGKWNEYVVPAQTLTTVNPVALDKKGNLRITHKSYTKHRRVKKSIKKNLKKLKPGLYK